MERDSRKALRSLGLERAELSVLFAGQRRMRKLNLLWRGVDSTTDVLSFPMYASPREFPKEGEFLLGDIAIDPLRAKEQADRRGHSLKGELRLLLVHGILHLMGHDHENGGPGARKMRRKEREVLEALRG